MTVLAKLTGRGSESTTAYESVACLVAFSEDYDEAVITTGTRVG